MADYGNTTYKQGDPTPGFNLDLTSGGQQALRKPSPFQALATALAPLVPARRMALMKASSNPFALDPSKGVNRRKNPFLISLLADPKANGINIPT